MDDVKEDIVQRLESPIRVLLGTVFSILWLIGAGAFTLGAIMALAMANDSGSMSNEMHMIVIVGFLFGIVLEALAGVFAGIAIAMRGKWKLFLPLSGGSLVIGLIIQIVLMTLSTS